MRKSPDQLCKRLKYQFDDPSHLEQALTHRSAGNVNNERLEFLGDAILGMVVADWLYTRFESAAEGELSRLRAYLVKRETLAAIAAEIDLGEYLLMGVGEQRSGGQSRASTLADAFEALIAAVYLDKGLDQARKMIMRLFDSRLADLTIDFVDKDPKTKLQEYLQGKNLELPAYEIITVTGKQHAQQFEVRCRVSALGLEASGTGRSRRKAEQAAAEQLLKGLENE